MKTKTKIVAGVVATLLSVTALSAQMMNQEPMRAQGYMSHHSMEKNAHGMRGSHSSFMPLLFKLNLSDEQHEKIKKIVSEYKKAKPTPYKAFSANGFDEDAYVKEAMTKKENMIKLRAKMISKVYAVLNGKQKSQLRVLMDLKEERMKEGCRFDKNSYGRG